tara:strand:- start:19362 stop:21332 length:1971 start_codon:yes stop_codon:yes gene_type:complete
MGEAYREMYESNMDQMRKAAKGSMQTIKFKDGKLKMDSFTASAIMGVYDKVNPKNRASMEKMINDGTKSQIMKLQKLAMKSIKSENDPTVDEHANAKPHPHPHRDDEEDKGELATTDEAQARQLKDKKKEMMVKSKTSGVIVIDKKDFKKYQKKGYFAVEGTEIKEGTWHIGKDKKGLKKLLQKPIKLGRDGEGAVDAIAPHIGDDELYDDLYSAGKKNPNGDARPAIKIAMKRLGIKEEVEIEEKFTMDDFAENEDDNNHTENAVELAKQYGDNYEKRQMAQVKKDHDKNRSISAKDQKVRDAIIKKYYPKLKKDYGSGPYDRQYESLDEAKYDLYHKDFSSAMQHAYKMAKKLHGITIDPKEIDDKVATGPSKPGSGKTNKYRLKGDKGSIQVQVYNKGGSKPFELNMYKEELDEKKKEKPPVFKGTPAEIKKQMKAWKKKHDKIGIGEGFPNGDGPDVPAMEVGTDRYQDYVKELTPGESVEEGSAAADARRAIGRDKDLGRRKDSADDDDSATDDDVKAASKNIIMQMRKVVSLKGNFKVEFGNGKKEKIDVKVAQAVQSKYNSIKRPQEKQKFQAKVAKSKKDLLNALKESLEEGKMGQIDALIKQGKSAKEIAKAMKVDVKTINKLMSSYNKEERTLFKINSKIKEIKNG